MVTVREIIKMDKFNHFRLIAGEQGLDRMVIRGGILDYESIDNLKDDNIKDEILLSNLPMIKDQPEMIVAYVQELIDSNTAGFALKTSLFKEFPKGAIELANMHNYPLFLFDEFFLDKLVIDIDKFISDEEQLSRKIVLIKKIQSNNLSQEEVTKCVKELNNYFLERLLVCTLKRTEACKHNFDIKLAKNLLGQSSLVVPIEDIIMIIFSSELIEINKNVIVQKLGLKTENHHIGVSGYTNDYSLLGQLINESTTALKYSIYKDSFLESYSELGVYQLLFPALEQPTTNYYYMDLINKIEDYDNLHHSDLLVTTITFVKADGNIKKTAEKLYQHENTIRFRVRKMKELISYEAKTGSQYETLALAVHLYELKKNQHKFKNL